MPSRVAVRPQTPAEHGASDRHFTHKTRGDPIFVALGSCALLTLVALCVGGAMLIVRDSAGWYALAAATALAAAGIASLRSLRL